jgi:hypothetical protein
MFQNGRAGRGLVIADARVDQDIVVRRLYDEALNTQHQAAADRIDAYRLQPGTVLLKKFFGERREEFHHVEERLLLLDHLVNRDVLECDCCRHRGAFLSLINRRRMLLVQPARDAITCQEPVPGAMLCRLVSRPTA